MKTIGERKKFLDLISFSDTHTYHPRTETSFILRNLTDMLPKPPEAGELDIIYIAGDFFDSIKSLSDDCVMESMVWISWFLDYCNRWNIKLRVLEGTPSHDRRQPYLFDAINKSKGSPVDCKYMDTLCIEHIEEFGIDILYLPDEWDKDPADTWDKIEDLLKEHMLDKVDFVVMHGMFGHQLPNGIMRPHHDAEKFLSITKQFVFVGHIHQMSVFDRIVSHGSTDRLSFNEEEPKGIFRAKCDLLNPENSELIFIENKGAKRYDTLRSSKLSPKAMEAELDKLVATLPDGSYIRLEAPQEPAYTSMYTHYKSTYEQFNWKYKRVVGKVADDDKPKEVFTSKAVPLNERTLPNLVSDKVIEAGVEEGLRKNILARLDGVING